MREEFQGNPGSKGDYHGDRGGEHVGLAWGGVRTEEAEKERGQDGDELQGEEKRECDGAARTEWGSFSAGGWAPGGEANGKEGWMMGRWPAG